MTAKSVFILSGEHSGDLHGGALLRALRARNPDWTFAGVGGPDMLAQGLQLLIPMADFQVFGFTDIVKKFPKLWRQFHFLSQWILENHPDIVILVDYPGFNLRLARKLRKSGYKGKIVQLISPTVWAWGKGRIDTLAANYDLLLTIFPFEPPLFAHTKLPVKFIGHPLVEKISEHRYNNFWREDCRIPPAVRSLAIFPGSRPSEVQRLLTRQLEAAKLLRADDPDLQILISCADDALKPALELAMDKSGLSNSYLIPKSLSYELMDDCHTALAKSGTVTLEIALHDTPCVVVYEVSRFNAWIGRHLIGLKLKFFCIVNILCNKEIFPEFIVDPFTAKQLAEALLPLHREGPARENCVDGCREARQALETPTGTSVAERAAQAIEELVLR